MPSSEYSTSRRRKLYNYKQRTKSKRYDTTINNFINRINSIQTKINALKAERTTEKVEDLKTEKSLFDKEYATVVAKTWFGGKKIKRHHASKSKTSKKHRK
jgi:predicted metal-dependent peptidase